MKNNWIITMLFLACITGRVTAQTTGKSMSKTIDMVITRTFDAPLKKVWQAWSDETLVKQWWGPSGFTAPLVKMNFRKGGTSLVCMRSPEGFEIFNTWTYTDIIPMSRIAFVQHFTDNEGRELSPSAIGMPPGIPDEVQHVVTFREAGNGRTEISIIESGYTDQKVVEISKAGMSQVLDKMAVVLKEK